MDLFVLKFQKSDIKFIISDPKKNHYYVILIQIRELYWNGHFDFWKSDLKF